MCEQSLDSVDFIESVYERLDTYNLSHVSVLCMTLPALHRNQQGQGSVRIRWPHRSTSIQTGGL